MPTRKISFHAAYPLALPLVTISAPLVSGENYVRESAAFLAVDSFGEGNLWLFDRDLDWLWKSSEAYPFFYFPRFASWLYCAKGTSEPRWFYEFFNFADWITEMDL